LPWLLRLVC